MTQAQIEIKKRLTEARDWLKDAERLLTRAKPDRVDAMDSLRIAARRVKEVEERVMEWLAHG